MRAAYALLLVAILWSSASNGQLFAGNSDFLGLKNVFAGINKMREDIQRNVDQLNQRIRENVRGYFARVEAFHQDLRKKLGTRLPVVTDTGKSNAIMITSNPGRGGSAGAARTVYSGYTPEGEPYYRDSERKVINGILHHLERVYDPVAKKIKEYRYTLDLNKPHAKPVESRLGNIEEEKQETSRTVAEEPKAVEENEGKNATNQKEPEKTVMKRSV